jgi:AraC-like DNA-binding protein
MCDPSHVAYKGDATTLKVTGPKQELGISSAVVEPVVHALRELGVEVSAAAPGDERGDLVVAGSFADRLIDAAAVQLSDEALGLHLAQRIPIGGLGVLDYALCTSANLGDAVRRVARHYGVVTQRVKLSLVETPDWATLVFERRPNILHSRHWIEFSLAMIAERIRQTLGQPVVFTDVGFAHGPPKDRAAHDGFFGTPVVFDQSDERMTFARALLEMPLRTAASSLAEVLDARMRELEPRFAPEDPFVDRVRRVVVELLDERKLRLSSAAARLRLKPRTLQRELERRGLSHQQIVDDVRRERALVLLGVVPTVAEVAYELGFSEPSAFFRAFRRWTGTSPRAMGEKAG